MRARVLPVAVLGAEQDVRRAREEGGGLVEGGEGGDQEEGAGAGGGEGGGEGGDVAGCGGEVEVHLCGYADEAGGEGGLAHGRFEGCMLVLEAAMGR